MSIRELCNREVLVARADEALDVAVSLMRHHHVGDVVVVEERQGMNIPIGLLTDRDVLLEVMAEGVDSDALTIGDVMSRDIWTLPQEEDLFSALSLMRSKGVRRLPIVNEAGALEGLLTVDDVIELLGELLTDISSLIRLQPQQEQRLRP